VRCILGKRILLTREEKVLIHEAIHSNGVHVDLPGRSGLWIQVTAGGLRFVTVGGDTYMEQNPKKTSSYAQQAREGAKITWIIRRGEWGMIKDGKVWRD